MHPFGTALFPSSAAITKSCVEAEACTVDSPNRVLEDGGILDKCIPFRLITI